MVDACMIIFEVICKMQALKEKNVDTIDLLGKALDKMSDNMTQYELMELDYLMGTPSFPVEEEEDDYWTRR